MRQTTPLAALMIVLTLFAAVCGVLIWVSPPEVDMTPVIMELGGLVLAIGVVCLGLFAASVPSGDPDRLPSAARASAIVVAILTVGGGIRAGLDVGEARQVSDDILIDRPDLGHGAAVLRANLKGATVVAPDRPHNPQDLSSGNRFDRTQRTRAFKVDTNAAGFRGPAFSPTASGLRIAALGDSFTFGWGVEHGQAWPAQLQAITSTETLNLGIPAANLEVLVALAEQQRDAWDADIVLICEWPMLMRKQPIVQFKQLIGRLEAAVSPAKVGVILPAVSSFDPLKSDIGPNVVTDLRTALGDTPLLYLNDPLDAAGGSGVVLERRGDEQLMVRVPSGDVVARGSGPADRIAEPIIRALEEDRSLQEPFFFDGGHTTVQGNTIVAQATADWLSELGWLR